jgi:hypothetical protein
MTSLSSNRVLDLQHGTGTHLVVKHRNNRNNQFFYFDQATLTIKNVRRSNMSISMHNRNSNKKSRDYLRVVGTHGRTNNDWQRFRWNEKEGALELMRDGRRIELHGKDKEGQLVDYHPADSNRPQQKWKLVYKDKLNAIKNEGKARGFRINKPFFILSDFGMGNYRRVMTAHGAHHVRMNDLARLRNKNTQKWIYDNVSKGIFNMQWRNYALEL